MYRRSVPRSPSWICEGTDRSLEEDKVSPSSFPSVMRKVTLPTSRCHPHPAKLLVGSCEWLVNSCNQGCRTTLLLGALVELRWLKEGQDTCIKGREQGGKAHPRAEHGPSWERAVVTLH